MAKPFTDAHNKYITGGIVNGGLGLDNTYHDNHAYNPGSYIDSKDLINTFNIPEDGKILIGNDMVMTTKEFKLCMKMLQKMAREEYPEEFI